jgi:metal-responsive CopG/Arc/MetJ family transcriptional regulator
MVMKPRSPGQTAISISIDEKLLIEIDARAKALGLNRSQYFAHVARQELSDGGDFVIRETPPAYGAKISSSQTPGEAASAEVVKIQSKIKSRRAKGSPHA